MPSHRIISSDSEEEQPTNLQVKKNDKKNDKKDKKSDKKSDKDDKKKDRKESKGKSSRKDGDAELMSMAHKIARCIDLWCDIDKVIEVAQIVEQEQLSKNGELEEDDADKKFREERLKKYDEQAREHYVRTYYKILQAAPTLKPLINDAKRTEDLKAATRMMQETMLNTRSVDTTSLKKHIAQYLPVDPRKEGLNPPIISGDNKAEFGFNHPVLGRFLCPVDHLEMYDENPSNTRKLLQSGKISMKAVNFPAFLWSGNKYPGDDYNPEDMNNGLFQSYLLMRVARHIYLGPTSAFSNDGKKGSKSSNAVLHDMTTIQPEHIAYVCMLTRFVISSMSSWNEKDGEFNFREFYRIIISYIEDAVDPEWKQALLDWWNMQIFGNVKGRGFSAEAKNANGSSGPAASMIERMRAQMEARMAARAAARLPSPPASSNQAGGSSFSPAPQNNHASSPDRTDQSNSSRNPGSTPQTPPSKSTPRQTASPSPQVSGQGEASVTPPSGSPTRKSPRTRPARFREHRTGPDVPVTSHSTPNRNVHCDDVGLEHGGSELDEPLTPLPTKTSTKAKGKKRAVDDLFENEGPGQASGSRSGPKRPAKRTKRK